MKELGILKPQFSLDKLRTRLVLYADGEAYAVTYSRGIHLGRDDPMHPTSPTFNKKLYLENNK